MTEPKSHEDYIDTICRMETTASWISQGMKNSPERQVSESAIQVRQAQRLLLNAAAQITSDVYDRENKLIQRPVYKVKDEVADDNKQLNTLLFSLTDLSAECSEVLDGLGNLMEWEEDLETDMEVADMLRSPCDTLRMAAIAIDGAKSIVAVTVAGYNYMDNFDQSGNLHTDDAVSILPLTNRGYL